MRRRAHGGDAFVPRGRGTRTCAPRGRARAGAAAAAAAADMDDARAAEIARLSGAVEALSAEQGKWAAALADARAAAEAAAARASAALGAKAAEAEDLAAALAARTPEGEVAEMRAQLALLRALHFNAEEEPEGDGGSGGDGGGGISGADRSALRRVRQLEATVVRLQREGAERDGAAVGLHTRASAAEEAAAAARRELSALEARLEARVPSGAGAGAARVGGGGGGDPAALLAAAVGFGGGGPDGGEACGEEDAASLAGVWRAQRDRQRARVAELEAERAGWARAAADAAARADRVTGDNVKLYEKIRCGGCGGGGGGDGVG